ncbi:MAG: hypothetical protein NTV62_03285 [Candidatus Gribaldobacteria bacterium]|nr:hypothetical protein [Candidatus Gribaldobacteria bacterium]
MDPRLYVFLHKDEWTASEICSFYQEPKGDYVIQEKMKWTDKEESWGKQYCKVFLCAFGTKALEILNHPYCRTWLVNENERGLAWLSNKKGVWQPTDIATHVVLGPTWPIIRVGSTVKFVGYKQPPQPHSWENKNKTLSSGRTYTVDDADSPGCCLYLGSGNGWVRYDEIQLCT